MASCLLDTTCDAAPRLGVQREGARPRAELAAQWPSSSVFKACNTTFDATACGQDRRAEATVFIAGDDTVAEAALADLVTAGGVHAIDAGSLARAHELEAIGFLQLTLAAETISWTGGFGVVT